VAGPALDELVSWSQDGGGRITGFAGVGGNYRLSALSRFLLPNLDPDFAGKGDVLEVEAVPFFESHVCGLVNVSRRRAETADPLRAALCAALILALPMPSVILAGRWWLLILSGLAAAVFLYLLFTESAALRRTLREERADFTLSAWRILKSRHTGLPPGVGIVEGPEPEWESLLHRAYAGALENHEAVELGALPVPDGKLLACEPFQIHDPRPYTIPVPPGTYPVFISIAAAPEGTDQRIAYAWVRLRDGAPARWERARTRRGEEVSFGVDSGMACFTSAAAAARLIVHYDRGDIWGYNEPLSEALVKAMDLVWRDTRGWAMIEAGEDVRLAAFSSGFGDGVYPVYRALDARGRRLAVAMVLFVDW
jgi:hypothetical protein